jgi:sugar/nucleoside kinase (ribokinase family)
MFPNVNGKLSAEQVRTRFAGHIVKAKHFHTEASQLALSPVREGIRMAHQAGVRVIFDLDVAPSYFAQAGLGTERDLLEALQTVDVLKPCKAAAREITGETDCEKIAARLLSLGPKIVAVTMGEDGCLVASANTMERVPSFHVSVVDTTGAGDAFMGGFSFGMLQGWDLSNCGLFANGCAALCCTKVGARAMGRRTEVMALIKSQRPADAGQF